MQSKVQFKSVADMEAFSQDNRRSVHITDRLIHIYLDIPALAPRERKIAKWFI